MKKVLIALIATLPLVACAHGPDYRGNDAAAFIGGAIVGAVISANRPVYVQPPVVYQQQPVYVPPVVVPQYNPTPNVYYQQVPSPYGGAPCSYVHQPYRAPTLICQ